MLREQKDLIADQPLSDLNEEDPNELLPDEDKINTYAVTEPDQLEE